MITRLRKQYNAMLGNYDIALETYDANGWTLQMEYPADAYEQAAADAARTSETGIPPTSILMSFPRVP